MLSFLLASFTPSFVKLTSENLKHKKTRLMGESSAANKKVPNVSGLSIFKKIISTSGFERCGYEAEISLPACGQSEAGRVHTQYRISGY